jgi:hypothetical protein
MDQAGSYSDRGKVIGLQERRLDRTILRTYRTKLDVDDLCRVIGNAGFSPAPSSPLVIMACRFENLARAISDR